MGKSYQTTLLIYTPEVTSRVEYIFELIFSKILGIECLFTTHEEEFLRSELPKINYSAKKYDSGLFLKAHPILFEKGIKEQQIETVEYMGMQLFFPSSDDSFLPFDPFASAFYLVTRYEEYLSENTDEHERFTDAENLLVKLNLHQKPVVDLFAYWLASEISAIYPEFRIRRRSFQFVTSIDIDNAWAFKNKSLAVSIGAIAKAILNGRWYELRQRLNVFMGFRIDPYDTYKYILDTYQGLLDHIVFFILIGNRDQYDRNVSFKNKNFRQLVSSLSSVCEVGIHPSYASNHKPWLFETEKERLEEITGKPVTQSRQHFLKLKMPQTYQQLIKSGITDDFTLGFASLAGFRAGTCTPFYFFDLSLNQCTDLLIHPFQVMDVTMKNYLQLDTDEARQLIEGIMKEVKNVNGTFISLWHNESLKDSGQWQGWRSLFEQILETGKIFENE